MRSSRIVAMWVLLIAVGFKTPATVVSLTPTKDATIFQNNSSNSLGGGSVMLAGTNSASSPRRSLVAFDVADVIPAGSTIEGVQLTLTYAAFGGSGGGSGSPPNNSIELQRLLGDWGEGTVGTGTGTGGVGQGFAANPGDATWSSKFFGSQLWSTPGGDFSAAVSASQLVGGTTLNIPFTWGSTSQLVADVQSWLDNPSTNFGWILLGPEIGVQTFRGFYTREAAAGLQPTLTITYSAVPEASSFALTALGGLVLLQLSRRFRKTSTPAA